MPEIVFHGYDSAPNPRKVLQALALFHIPYKYVEIPTTLPRPDFATMDITYRRTPLLSIDNDMYVDTSLIIEKLCEIAEHSESDVDTANHVEYHAMGNEIFSLATRLLPADHPMLQDEHFLQDRAELIGASITPALLTMIRPATLSAMLTYLSLIKRKFLANGREQFVLGGEKPTTADIYLYFAVNYGLRFHTGAQADISQESHPEIYAWLDAVGGFLETRNQVERVTWADAKAVLVKGAKQERTRLAKPVEDSLLGLHEGQQITVTPVDTGLLHPQRGELVRLNAEEVCLRNKSGLAMHFPRLGYNVAAAT